MNDARKGTTVVLTGVSSGIGRAMARSLAGEGATLYAVARPTGEGAAVVRAIARESGNPDVHFVPADLSTLDGMRAAAAAVRGFTSSVDILINNAGAFFVERRTTADGLEMTFALDHLAYFVVTVLLLPQLLADGGGRVVNTASEAQRAGRIHFDDLMLERNYNGWRAYSQAKLANVMFTAELAARLEFTGVTANAFHPGFVASGFGGGNRMMNRLVQMAGKAFGRSPERGAETGLWLATSPELEGVRGRYYADRKELKLRPDVRDREVRARLWNRSEALAELTERERAPLLEVSAWEAA